MFYWGSALFVCLLPPPQKKLEENLLGRLVEEFNLLGKILTSKTETRNL
jgi:hypothetical protein